MHHVRVTRPLHISCETRHFYSREYYWSKYCHEENYWVNQCYHSHIEVTHPDEPQTLQPYDRQSVTQVLLQL